MPDYYYDGAPSTGPEALVHSTAMEALGHSAGKPCMIWELFAGSGKLSAMARRDGVSHLPPVDFRWGYDARRLQHQTKILFAFLVYGCEVLFASPNCTPWGANARQWSPAKRKEKRHAEGLTLRFLTMLCFLQVLMGISYMMEKPRGSEICSDKDFLLH